MAAARPDTWMPIYWGDYAKDTGHLGAAHHGAYLMLIKHYWVTGEPLPNDDAQLWRIACADSLAHWRKIKGVVLAFFDLKDGLLHHKRIDEELVAAVGFIEQRREAGKASAERRKRQRQGNDRSNERSNESSTDAQQASQRGGQREGQREAKTSPSPSPSPSQVSNTSTVEASSDARARAAADEDALRPPAMLDRSAEARALAAWNDAAKRHSWPEAQFLNSVRRSALNLRLAECGGIDGWFRAINFAEEAGFLKDQRWFDLDWMLKPENFTRLMEGRYAERRNDPREKSGPSAALEALAEFGRTRTG